MAVAPNTVFADLLPKELTSTVGRVEFLARTRKQGSITGRHASPHKGFSVEFAEHRQYVAGDDLRDLDWRVFGKSDRYYIKQYIEETNMRVTLVVDASGSMSYTGESAATLGGKALSKFAYARHLAAAFTYLFIRQQDAVGLVTFDTEVRRYLRPVAKPSQVSLVLEELHGTSPGAETSASTVLHDVAERIPVRGLVILFSDMFDDAEKLHNALHHFHYKRHEVIVFHVMAEEELTFPFTKFDHFRCLETPGLRLNLDPRTLRATYLERVRAHVAALEKACGQMSASYVPVNTKIPVQDTLMDYFARRRAGK
ncbi:MAG: DUF58 domain-containing protein [Verrucomicrobiales bacterium]|nr:DUF58 domain-containing protein [Verrucomicrobiae bacterium]MCC6883998.1 DUF58 domain-containing protein [Verrucomicrobiales bacterium]MCP5554802.1 DUF58 domain-containing protein [Akkermansiaceae bacterium]